MLEQPLGKNALKDEQMVKEVSRLFECDMASTKLYLDSQNTRGMVVAVVNVIVNSIYLAHVY